MADERTIRGELEGYLKERDLNEYFTSIIESCLLAQPENPSMHITKHLFSKFPGQFPLQIGQALGAVEKAEAAAQQARMASAAKDEVDDANEASRPSSSSSSVGSSIRSGGDRSGAGLGLEEVDEDSTWEAEAEHPVDALALKLLDVAKQGGAHVFFGGWPHWPFRMPLGATASPEDFNNEGKAAAASKAADEEIFGGSSQSRAAVAVAKLKALAESREVRSVVLQRHFSLGWSDGRRDAISSPSPLPAPPNPPDPGPFLTHVKKDTNQLEVLLPALQKLTLGRDLTDWQLLLLGHACTVCSSPAGAVVVPADGASTPGAAGGGSSHGSNNLQDSLIVVCAGSLAVREVASPPSPPPRFDDGAVWADTAGAGGSGGDDGERGGDGDVVVRQVARLKPGEVYGEAALFAPHEHYTHRRRRRRLPNPVAALSASSLDSAGGGSAAAAIGAEPAALAAAMAAADAAVSEHNASPPRLQVVVPLTEGGGCRYWRLPRSTLHAMRADWAKSRIAERVVLLRGVPMLDACLNDTELHQMAALAEEVGYASRASVATEGNLLKDLCVVMQGHATFKRGGECLMEKVGPGAFWGDLALVQGPRLCQASVFAADGKIIGKHGPIPSIARDPLPTPPPPNSGPSMARPRLASAPPPAGAASSPSSAGAASPAVQGSEADLTGPPAFALITLVVRAEVVKRMMGPLIAYVNRSENEKQAAVFSRVVC